MVEMGHFPSCPPIEIRRPWNSSSQTFSTVPAFPSVRTTALPTSSDWASSNAPRITDARSFTDGMDVSEVRRVSRRRDLTESADPAQCGGHSCAFLKGDSHAALSGSDDDRKRSGDRITLLRLYVENATQWNLDHQGTRADFKRALDRRIQTAPDRDIEREIARLHFYSAKSGLAQYAGDALLRCK